MERSIERQSHGHDRKTCLFPGLGSAICSSTKNDPTGLGAVPVEGCTTGKSGARFYFRLFHGISAVTVLSIVLVFPGAARAPQTGSGAQIPGSDVAQLEKNRLEIEAMDARQLNELRKQKTRFDNLSIDEQDRMRLLHVQLQSHPERTDLEKIMLRYMDWLKSLDPVDQAVFLDKQGDERLREICRMRSQQSRQLAVLSPSDNLEFEAWFRNLAESKNAVVAEAVDRIALRKRNNGYRPEKTASHEAMLRYVFFSSERETAKIVTQEEIGKLNDKLSSRGREILEQGDNVRAIRMLITNPVSEYELRRFFEDKLSPLQRAELYRLAPEEMKRQIRRLYFFSRLGLASDQK